MSIPMKFNPTIKAFNQWVNVDHYGIRYNEAGNYEERHLLSERIKAIVLMLSIEQLQLLQQGETSDAGISIITRTPLYFPDNAYPDSNSIQKQTYIHYAGYTYRVVGTGNTQFNATHYCYTALRYLK